MSCTGMVFMAPSMTRRAMFWILSSLLLVLAAVPHVVDAYSMVVLLLALTPKAHKITNYETICMCNFCNIPVSTTLIC